MKHFLLLVSIAVFMGCNNNQNIIIVDERPVLNEFTLTKKTIQIPQADFDHAIYFDDLGYRRINRNKFDVKNQGYVLKEYEAVILENPYIRLTLLPKLGKPYSLIYKVTGNEEFFLPKIAHLHYSPNKLGWWFMLGGVEYTLPDKEHGDTWATDWQWETIENSDKRKTIRMKVKELRFGLEELIDISIVPNKAYYISELHITNPTDSTVHFQHWINPMWTPGGKGELTPNTEFIIPTKEVYATNRKINDWMLDFHPQRKRLQSYEKNPMKYLKNWQHAGDLLAWKLEHGYYSVFSHEQNEGIVRVFPLETNHGCNIWSWGYKPDSRISELFSGDSTNAGYVEMWGGITHGFDKYYTLKAGESISWTEWMYPYIKTNGLHFANKDFAVTFFKNDNNTYRFFFCPSGLVKNIRCTIVNAGNQKIIQQFDIKSAYPKKDIIKYSIPSNEGNLILIFSKNGQEIIRLNSKNISSKLLE